MVSMQAAFNRPSSRPLAAARSVEARPAQRVADNTDLRTGDFLLTDGAVAAFSIHASGRTAAMEIIVAPALLLHSDEQSYVALGQVTVVATSGAGKLSAEHLCRYWRERTRFRNIWLSVVLFERAQARVAFLLHVLAEIHQAATVPVRLSYERIAQLCGISWRSVERCVGGWLRRGLVERRACYYTIVDPEGLAEQMGDSADVLDIAGVRRIGRELTALVLTGAASNPYPFESSALKSSPRQQHPCRCAQ